MTPTEALTILAKKFPDRYFSVSATIGSMHAEADQPRRTCNQSVSVYVENSKHYYAQTLSTAVRMAINDNYPEGVSEAEAVIEAIEQPEATYPSDMKVEEATA